MKRMTASEARESWFRLLDEVASGEVVVIERRGRRVVLRSEGMSAARSSEKPPDYRKILQVPEEESADTWSWEWSGPEAELTPKNTLRR